MLDKITNFPICLAPMVGLSHVAMRETLRLYMPEDAMGLWPTEMLSSYRLPKQKIHQVSMAKKTEGEQGLVPQILGNEQKPIEDSISILKDWGCVGVDINMGCPVKKALRHNYGVSLMGDPSYASEVVKYAVGASDLPVSVKFRAGIQKDLKVLEKFSLGIQKAGASWVTLHPRTSKQKRRGKADWTQINFLKNTLDIPVIGNGDVRSFDDFIRMREETGCDMVMVGRALTVRPWLLWQVGESLGFSSPRHFKGLKPPVDGYDEGAEFGRHLKRLLDSLYLHFTDKEALKYFRFYVAIGHSWLMFGHDLMRKTTKYDTKEKLRDLLDDFFSRPQKMMKETSGVQ